MDSARQVECRVEDVRPRAEKQRAGIEVVLAAASVGEFRRMHLRTVRSQSAKAPSAATRPVVQQSTVTPPKTPLGQELGYLARQWKRLLLFLEDGNVEATNNRRERELRRLVLGRRNWLFTWLDDSAERTAIILSVVATCIAYDVNPRAYLH